MRGLRFFDRGQYANAIRDWKPLAEEGDCNAQYRYGTLSSMSRVLSPLANISIASRSYTVPRAGGWKTTTMVQRYHLIPDYLRAAVEKFLHGTRTVATDTAKT
jgi:hypothetical protein